MRWLIYLNLVQCAVYAEALSGQNVRIAEDHEYPFVVSIGKKNLTNSPDQNQYCTGVLISNRAVLTAAHCFYNEIPELTEVILGSADLYSGRRFNVTEWITFNEWAAMTNRIPNYAVNDIGVILVSRPIDDLQINPVVLSPLNKQQFERTKGMILGFGVTNNGSSSRYLMAGKVKILSEKTCMKRVRIYSNKVSKLQRNQFCSASTPYILSDCGDSGGPILNKYNDIVGINVGVCPLRQTSWYQLQGFQVEQFLKGYWSNLHLSIDYYREFINDFL